MATFDKYLVVINSASTNIKRSLRRIDELSRLSTDKEIAHVHLEPKSSKNKDILYENRAFLGEKTLICVAGGDGTTGATIAQLLTDKRLTPSQKRSVVLPLWGGNANDLGHMLNGMPLRKSLKKILKSGKIVEINPLKITIKTKDKTNTYLAICYVSFGASANFAKKINDPEFRKNMIKKSDTYRLILEFNQFVKSFFSYDISEIELNGEQVKMFEFLIVNGSRMAKFNSMPVKITDSNYYSVLYSDKKPRVVATELIKIAGRRDFGTKTNKPINFVALQDLWAQLDGEVVKIKKGSKVRIERNSSAFRALSTK